jgi:uncharacterized protein YndB with AHSA1/START domain
MPEPTVIHNTFVIERSYPTLLEQVFAAFANPARKRRWYAESERHVVEQFEMDFQIGGYERARYRMGDTTPFPGVPLTNVGVFHDIVPGERIVSSSTMSLGDKRVSVSLVTVELLPTDTGTDLIFTHQAAFFEGSGGPQMREQGWQHLFERLARELAH